MELNSLPGGYAVNDSRDDPDASKKEALSQIDWLRSAVETGAVVGFLACGVDDKGAGFGLGVVSEGTNMQLMHDSLVKLHEVFHAGAGEVAERLAGDGGGDGEDATLQ